MRRKPSAPLLTAGLVASSAFIATWLGGSARAPAADIQLLSAAAMQSVFKQIAGDFQRTSGHRLVIRYATMGAITQRILDGETADLVIGSAQSISRLAMVGRIKPGSQLTICKTGVGIVVPSGAPKPQVTSAEDLKRALLDARVVVYADPAGGGAAGIHIAKVIERLGIAKQLSAKTKLGAGGDVTEVTLAEGVGALGLTQISEIVGKWGAELVGPLPGALQNYTGVAAGVPTGASHSDAVAAFLSYLQSPAAIAAIEAKGMQVAGSNAEGI